VWVAYMAQCYGPSRGPCIDTIYPTLLGFGGIQHSILSYNEKQFVHMEIIWYSVNQCHDNIFIMQSWKGSDIELITHPLLTSQCTIPAVIPLVTEKTGKRESGWTGRGSYFPNIPAAVSIMTFSSLYAQIWGRNKCKAHSIRRELMYV